MKKFLIGLVLALGLFGAPAQDTNSVVGIAKAWADTQAGLLSAKNWTVSPYGTYAPNAPHKVGGGVFVSYNLSEYVSPGIGLDYLGQLTMPSGNVTLKLPIKVSKITVTPFALAAVALPVGGAGDKNYSAVTIVGGGASAKVWTWKSASLDAGFAVTKWIGAGDYSGIRYQPFVAFHISMP